MMDELIVDAPKLEMPIEKKLNLTFFIFILDTVSKYIYNLF